MTLRRYHGWICFFFYLKLCLSRRATQKWKSGGYKFIGTVFGSAHFRTRTTRQLVHAFNQQYNRPRTHFLRVGICKTFHKPPRKHHNKSIWFVCVYFIVKLIRKTKRRKKKFNMKKEKQIMKVIIAHKKRSNNND